MLFAIPYCATQSVSCNLHGNTRPPYFCQSVFPAYAVVLIVLRLSLRNLFDKLPFQVFLLAGIVSELMAILLLTLMNNNVIMILASCFLAGGGTEL